VLDLANVLTIIDQPIISNEENKLLGVTFCITGSLSRSRKEIQQEIKQKGGKVVGSVSSNLGYLVAGEKSGSKLSKAQSLGVTIITEAELSALLIEDESARAETTDNVPSVDDNIKAQKGPSQTSLYDH